MNPWKSSITPTAILYIAVLLAFLRAEETVGNGILTATVNPELGRLTIDGTLYVALATGMPYIVFCHDRVQIVDGSMEYLELTPNLCGVVAQPHTIFHASSAPRVSPTEAGNFVTDGPFLFRDRCQLYLLWSSVNGGRYTMGLARSDNGEISDQRSRAPHPAFAADGGHGMLFTTFGGKFMVNVHAPNHPCGAERMRLIAVDPAQMIELAFDRQ